MFLTTGEFCYLLDMEDGHFVNGQSHKNINDIIEKFSFFKHGSAEHINFFPIFLFLLLSIK